MLDKKFWKKIGMNVVARYRESIFDFENAGAGAKDVYGEQYPPFNKYSSGYRKFKGASKGKFRNSSVPVLTGALHNDFKIRKTSKEGITFGTTSWGGKVRSLAKNKNPRVISDKNKPIPDEVKDYIMDQAMQYTEEKFGRKKKVKINITI